MLNNSVILIFTVAALFSAIFARLFTDRSFSAPLFVISFLCVAFCVTYAFLLGIDIEQVLTYILAFTLLTATVFLSKDNGNSGLPVNERNAK